MQPPARGRGPHRVGGKLGHASAVIGENPCPPLTPLDGVLQFRAAKPYMVCMGQFAVTERAATRIAEIAAADGNNLALRVSVLAGGCSGFQYRFELDKTQLPDDLVIEKRDARILVDPASMDLLAGSELDFTEALMGSHFAVRNPNATSSCGCGTSFSVD